MTIWGPEPLRYCKTKVNAKYIENENTNEKYDLKLHIHKILCHLLNGCAGLLYTSQFCMIRNVFDFNERFATNYYCRVR